jgi:hypothetical protein
MHRRLLCLLTALAALGAAPSLKAQDLRVDQPGKRHPTGAMREDPAAKARTPMEGEFRAFLPPSVDLSGHMPPPGDQGDAGTCTGFAIVYGIRSYYAATLEGRDLSDTRNLPSPGYIMSFIKGYGNASFDDVVDLLKKGTVSVADYPYTENGKPPPTRDIVARAHDFQVRGLRRVNYNRLDDVKGQLARGNPVVFMLWTDDAFQNYSGGTFNARGKATDDYHSIVVVGYDDRRQAFRLMNSWGDDWGDHGFMWLSYDLVKLRLDDAGVIDVAPPRRLPAPPPPRPAPPPPAPKVVQPVVPPPPPPPAPKVVQPVLPPPPPPPAPKVVQPVLPPPPPPPAPKVVQPVVPPPPPPPAPKVVQPVVPPPPPAPPTNIVQVVPPPPVPPQPPPVPTPVPPSPTPAPKPFAFLQNLACARVNVGGQGDSHVLSGFVGSDDDLRQVRQAAAAIPNTAVGDILVAPWPQCEALLTLEAPLAAADQPVIGINSGSELHEGDPLPITVQSPGQISYLYVSYIQADGSVVNLVQPDGLVPKPTLPGTTLTFGDGQEGRAKFTVSPPFGHEMIIALASRSPLFDQPLPAQQHEREYLSALRRALIYKPSPDLPDREVTAAMKTLETHAR